MPSWTYTREEAKQICPELVIRPLIHLKYSSLSGNGPCRNDHISHHSTALSRSASSKITAGLLPPSSSVHRLRLLFAARAWTVLPVEMLPVKLTLATRIWLAKWPPVLPSPVTTWNTPGGKPASMINFPNSAAIRGVFSLGFRMNTLPVAKAGAALRPTEARGPFQGMILSVRHQT